MDKFDGNIFVLEWWIIFMVYIVLYLIIEVKVIKLLLFYLMGIVF